MSDHKPKLDKVKESVMAAMAKNSEVGDDEILLLVKEILNEESSTEADKDKDDDLSAATAASAIGVISDADSAQIEERVRDLVVSLVKEFTEDELPHLVEGFVRRRLREVL